MRWLGGVPVLCIVVGAVLWFPAQREIACLRNLRSFDHSINCLHWVAYNEEDATVSNGVWTDKKVVLETCSEGHLRCPITGKDYVLTFTVGEHPWCPVHGHLIEKYGSRPHDSAWLRRCWTVRRTAGLLSLSLGILLAVTVGIVALVRLSRKQRRMAQPSDGSDAAGDSEGREE